MTAQLSPFQESQTKENEPKSKPGRVMGLAPQSVKFQQYPS